MSETTPKPSVGFTSMAAKTRKGEIPELGIGMMGYAFMGKAHSNAYKTMPYMIYPPPAIPKLVAIAGRDEGAVQEASLRYGYDAHYTDWRALLKNDKVQVFDNGGPNDIHAEPCIAAAQAGKHILCEKPLARTAKESASMLEAVLKSGVKHMVSFNYRFVPAIRQVRKLIETNALGEIYHFRAAYLQEWIVDPNIPMSWRLDKNVAGSGALGDLGAHIIDLARFLVGEISQVSASARTFINERPTNNPSKREKVSVDDAFVAAIEFENGAIGTLEASRFCPGRKNGMTFEINGSKGSIRFNLERLNELDVFWMGENPFETQGFHNVLISESFHPFWEHWWPHGHMIGWEHSFIHEIAHFFDAIVNDHPVTPYGADFQDGYKCAVICDAILESAESGARKIITY
jgi:predicted dehydrogenase